MMTDKERSELLRDIAVVLGLEPDTVEPDSLIAAAQDASEARAAARFGSMKLGPH